MSRSCLKVVFYSLVLFFLNTVFSDDPAKILSRSSLSGQFLLLAFELILVAIIFPVVAVGIIGNPVYAILHEFLDLEKEDLWCFYLFAFFFATLSLLIFNFY